MKILKFIFYVVAIILLVQQIDWSFLNVDSLFEAFITTLNDTPFWIQVTLKIMFWLLIVGLIVHHSMKLYYRHKDFYDS